MIISFCAGSLESFLFMNTQECNAGMMADGYTRTTGKMLLVLTQLGGTENICIPLHGPSFKSFLTILRSMMIAQNGPGITNFVTPVKTAYWNHTPLLLVTPQAVWFDILEQRPDFSVFFSVFFEFWFPDHEVHDFLCWISWHGQIYLHCQAANKTIGQGGFQEVEQMAMFKDSVCYQEEAPFLKWMLLAAFWTEHFMAEHGKIGNSLMPFWRKSCWCLQVRDHTRICEVLNRVIEKVRASIWSICVL